MNCTATKRQINIIFKKQIFEGKDCGEKVFS